MAIDSVLQEEKVGYMTKFATTKIYTQKWLEQDSLIVFETTK